MIVAGTALAAAFPAIHPFAVIVVEVGDKDRLLRLDQPRLVGKKIVGRIDNLRTENRMGEIDAATGKIGESHRL